MSIPLAARVGYADSTTCKILIVSLTNGDITLSCNNVDQTATPTDYGNNDAVPQGIVGYKHLFTVTGLDAFTQYTFTATQGANTVTGSLYTLPGEDDDFCFYVSSCDHARSTGVAPPHHGDPGYLPYIKEYAQGADNLPVVGLFHSDDLGYPQLQNVVATNDGVSSTGAPSTTALQYDYAIAYTALMGLYDETGLSGGQLWYGANADRQWVRHNINIWPQWGDHEFKNDIGWDKATSDITDTPTNAAIFAAGVAMYNVFYGDLQPPDIQDQDTGANHWGFTCGSAYICSPDYITNASGGVTVPKNSTVSNPGAPSVMTTLYGTNQIEDILNALSNSSPFKVMGMGHGIRYLYDPNFSTEYHSGAQHTMFDHCLTEYQRMFTDNTHAGSAVDPKSLMHNPYTNGAWGTLITCHGDWHRCKVEHHMKAAYTNNAEENFYSFTIGGMNGGAASFRLDGVSQDTDYLSTGRSSIYYGYENQVKLPLAGADQGLTMLEYVGVPNVDAPTHKGAWGLRIEVYGSRTPKEMHVVAMGIEENGDLNTETGLSGNVELWRKKFVHRRGGNDAHDTDANLALCGGFTGAADD